MDIKTVFDPAFKPYGKVLEGYDTACLVNAMRTIPLPKTGTAYEPSIPVLEATCLYGQLQNNAYGGMPVQIGMCWGRNTRLNCLEYHRDSEVNVGEGDFILLLARQEEIVDGVLDTSCVKAFRVPAGVPVEVYSTTTAAPGARPVNEEDTWLTARNKWLLAHPESDEGKGGAHIGLKGVNIDIANDI